LGHILDDYYPWLQFPYHRKGSQQQEIALIARAGIRDLATARVRAAQTLARRCDADERWGFLDSLSIFRDYFFAGPPEVA